MRTRRVVVVNACWVLTLALLSCSDDRDAAYPGDWSVGGHAPVEPCADGETRACGFQLAEHEGVILCGEGIATCSEGVWGECVADSIVAKADTGFDLHALSTPNSCNNACDPNCMAYGEVPSVALSGAPGGSLYGWGFGGDPPAGTSTTPCQDARDCQGDTRCVNPDSPSTCEHDVCVTGTPLDTACGDECVQAVCAANPACCQQGTPCNTAYGAAAGYYACPNASSSTSCVFNHSAAVSCDSICAAGGGTCQGTSNDATTDNCSPIVTAGYTCSAALGDAICNCTRPGVGSWSAACVNLVTDLCGAYCQGVATTAGTCVPWAPAETDATCSGIDLTVGVGCAGKLVVCNRGTMTAPAGINVAHYPTTDGSYATCNPALPGSASTCTTASTILPGRCIDVDLTTCGDPTTGPRRVYVNPPGAGQVAECHTASCLNNFALWNPVACGTVSCTVDYVSPSTCVFAPQSAHIVGDPASVKYDNGVDGPSALNEVANAGACTGSATEWYWTDASQATITLCPATCTALNNGADQCNLVGQEYYDAATERCYLYGADNGSWAEQQVRCNNWKGSLAAISSATENTFVEGIFTMENPTKDTWLGGRDATAELFWRWENGEPWLFSKWDTGTPNSDTADNCIERQKQDGNWIDQDCGRSQHRLCERGKLAKTITIDTPCATAYTTAVFTQTYEPDCGPGRAVQWGFLGWNTATPGDSTVGFRFRVAHDVASLSSATWLNAGTASAALMNAVCSITAPSGSCPVDLFLLVDGLPLAREPVAEIEITVTPATGGAPTAFVNGWTLTYSCVDSE